MKATSDLCRKLASGVGVTQTGCRQAPSLEVHPPSTYPWLEVHGLDLYTSLIHLCYRLPTSSESGGGVYYFPGDGTLVIERAGSSDNGEYECIGENEYGRRSASTQFTFTRTSKSFNVVQLMLLCYGNAGNCKPWFVILWFVNQWYSCQHLGL